MWVNVGFMWDTGGLMWVTNVILVTFVTRKIAYCDVILVVARKIPFCFLKHYTCNGYIKGKICSKLSLRNTICNIK